MDLLSEIPYLGDVCRKSFLQGIIMLKFVQPQEWYWICNYINPLLNKEKKWQGWFSRQLTELWDSTVQYSETWEETHDPYRTLR